MSSGYDWKRLGTVQEAVVTVIGDHFGLYGRILPSEMPLSSAPSADDIDKLEILMTMEELFRVRFDDDSRERVRTVGDVIDLVQAALSHQQISSEPSTEP